MHKDKARTRDIYFFSQKSNQMMCVHSERAREHARRLEEDGGVESYEVNVQLNIDQYPYPAKYRNLLSAFIITNCENIENRGNFYMSKICKFSVNYCDIAILIPIEYNEWAYELATRTQLKLNIDSGLAQNTLTPSPIKHTRCPMNSGTKKRA